MPSQASPQQVVSSPSIAVSRTVDDTHAVCRSGCCERACGFYFSIVLVKSAIFRPTKLGYPYNPVSNQTAANQGSKLAPEVAL